MPGHVRVSVTSLRERERAEVADAAKYLPSKTPITCRIKRLFSEVRIVVSDIIIF